ncbi:chemotaxis protein CheA, partial [Vibrio sp. V26_P1S5P106]|uniref:Hpt domain-containing protein n=1 Tax=Vibrio sp. V26_P1S5P106 TaxID=1938678 RepID=UPI001394E4CC
MSYDLDEDILQDFLVEAGEILELLSEQLVELENNPQDRDLLNAIFRGFHTVKGGAGFLALTELVETCHGAENVFDYLRNGQRSVTASLMDTMLRALDTVNEQFQAVQNREPVQPADPQLIEELHALCKPESEDEPSADQQTPPAAEIEAVIDEPVVETPASTESTVSTEHTTSSGSIDDISEDEFEKLLDELHGKGRAPGAETNTASASTEPSPSAPTSSSSNSDSSSGDITDDEFEKLLDELHGQGKGPSVHETSASSTPDKTSTTSDKTSTNPAASSSFSSDSDLMTDEEFERLLDELHGSGKGPSIDELEMATKPASAISQSSTSVSQTTDSKTAAQTPVEKAASSAVTSPVKATPTAEKREVTTAASPVKKPQQQVEATVRVDTSTLDTIMNMVGELVLVRNRLLSLGLNSNDEEMSKAVSNLDVVTADLQG